MISMAAWGANIALGGERSEAKAWMEKEIQGAQSKRCSLEIQMREALEGFKQASRMNRALEVSRKNYNK